MANLAITRIGPTDLLLTYNDLAGLTGPDGVPIPTEAIESKADIARIERDADGVWIILTAGERYQLWAGADPPSGALPVSSVGGNAVSSLSDLWAEVKAVWALLGS
jgi:hypothetical protein